MSADDPYTKRSRCSTGSVRTSRCRWSRCGWTPTADGRWPPHTRSFSHRGVLLGGQAFGHGPPQLLDRELRVTSALEAVVVHGDEPRLRQVIDNLLGNTLKYVPAGGSVSLRVSAHADLAVLEVSDDGPGFDRAAEELFARFVRGRAVTAAGSGIGLAVVAELVRAHGGTYEAGSSPLGGALVRLHLPA